MNLSPVILLSVSILGLVGCGLLLFFGLRRWNDEQQPKSGSVPASQADKPRANPRASFTSRRTSQSKPDTRSHEVLRIFRDNLTGRLLVEMAGQRYSKMGELPDPNLQQALLTTLRDLQEFAGAAPPMAPPRLEEAPPPTVPSPTPPMAWPKTLQPTSPASEPPALQRPSMNPFKQMRVLRELEKKPQPQLKSIPEHIDEFLQQKLLGTPYIWRGIRVRASPKGTVVFEADGKAYEAVDEVPDAEVRALIRAAVAEWEKTR